MKFDLPNKKSTKICVLGIGSGGCNALKYMYKQNIVGVTYIVSNTDAQVLSINPIENKIQLGPITTKGEGAGMNPVKGREATLESEEQIKNLLKDNVELLFITTGMGGGTGTGGAPEIARMARELGIHTISIVTTPFEFESHRKRTAEDGISKLREYTDALIVISNENIANHYGDLEIDNAFEKADDILSIAVKGIAETITRIGMINVDLADFKSIIKDCGLALIGFGKASGQNRVKEAVAQTLNCPLLNNSSIAGSKKIIINISYGKTKAKMSEAKTIAEMIQDAVSENGNYPTVEAKVGLCYDERLEDAISVTLVATGFEQFNNKPIKNINNIISVDLEDMPGKQIHIQTTSHTEVYNLEDDVIGQPFITAQSQRISNSYNHRLRMDFTNPTVISTIPSYIVKKKNIDKSIMPSDNSHSNVYVESSVDGSFMRTKNGYIHNNVD